MNHAPRKEFVDHLEWEIQSVLRRHPEWRPSPMSKLVSFGRIAALMIVCTCLGAGAIVASERLEDSRRKELLLGRTEIQRELLEHQILIEQQNLSEILDLQKKGLVAEEQVLAAQRQARLLQLERELLALELEEIAVSGRSPRRDLAAPFLNGRDFVIEGLELEARMAAMELEEFGQELQRTRRLVESGRAPEKELRQMRYQHQLLETQKRSVNSRIETRMAFLKGELSAANVDLVAQLEQARAGLQAVEVERQLLQEAVRESQIMAENGLVPEREVRRAMLEASRLESNAALMQYEIELLRSQLGR